MDCFSCLPDSLYYLIIFALVGVSILGLAILIYIGYRIMKIVRERQMLRERALSDPILETASLV